MAYTNNTLVSNYLKKTLSANETAMLAILIPAVKIWIDSKTSSTFDSASETTRYYDGCKQNIDIDPCTDITAVEQVDNYQTSLYTYQTYEYTTEPVNSTVKTQIRLRYGKFPLDMNGVSVTAKFSEYDSGVPEDIQTVATMLCGALLSSQIANGVSSESIEGHSISYDLNKIATENPAIKSILSLRRELLVD